MDLRLSPATAKLAVIAAVAIGAKAGTIEIPNGSFESPAVSSVGTVIDSWQNTPKPDWYDESGGFLWSQLTGVFKNLPPTADAHIDNCDGDQAIWLFAVPEAGLFQDYDSVGGTNTVPERAFEAAYEVGTSYTLTVGVLGGYGYGMIEGATLEIGFYYRDDDGNKVPLASLSITNSAVNFPVHTHLTDYVVELPVVQPDDPWAGRHIGVQLLSTVTPELQGGYWDLDNVRLHAVPPPVYNLTFSLTNGEMRLSWPSIPGYQYQVKLSEDLVAWSDYGPLQPGSGGELSQPVSTSDRATAFFTVVATPASAQDSPLTREPSR